MIADPGISYLGTLLAPNPDLACPPPDPNLPCASLQALWQYRDIVVENNLIELQPGRNAHIVASGIRLGADLPAGYTPGEQFTTLNARIRNNRVRYLAGPSGSPVGSYPDDTAFYIQYTENLLNEDNSVDLPGVTNPILHQYCKSVRYFNNSTPGGQLIQGELGSPGSATKQQELTTLVDDAFVLSML